MQALTATAIALSVAGVGVQGYVQSQAHAVRQGAGKAQGVQLDRLAAAVDNYAIQNFSRLTGGPGQILQADGVTPGTVVTPLLPTVQELVTLGYLQGAFNSTNFFGGGYVVSIGRLPVGCSYPNCALGGTVSMTNAILRGGVPDVAVLGAAMQQVGADAGFSPISSPGTISGVSGGWSLPNPAGSVAGILAERVGQGSQRYNAFVRRDGALPMTGALNLGGNAITGLQSAESGNTCPTQGDLAQGATGGVLSCQGGQWKNQGSMYWQDPVTSYAVLTGGAYPCNAGTAYQTRVVQTPSVGSGPRVFACDGSSWQPVGLDNSGNLNVQGGVLYAGGSNASYGAATVQGAKNGWSGLNFRGTDGSNHGTLMMQPGYSGFYNAADNNWRYYVDNSGNSYQPGTIQTGGRVTVGEYVQLNAAATPSAPCSPNGLVAHDGSGVLLSCQGGLWARVLGTGRSALYASLASRTISCADAPGYITASAYIDANGRPYVAIGGYYGSTGWVAGTKTSKSVYGSPGISVTASWTIDGGLVLYASSNAASVYCTSQWPLT